MVSAAAVQSAEIKWLRYGGYQAKIVSTGDMGEGGLGWDQSGYFPYNGFGTYEEYDDDGPAFASHAWYLETRNWSDEDANLWPYKMTGCGQWFSDELFTVMPVEDERGYELHQYVRYAPPSIVVDGITISDPFPFDDADHVDPDKLPGSAYAMLESWANTDMGVTLHQKVYCWAHDKHDDYLIYDWTFINTGNVDRDAEIELPDQTLDSLFFFRQERFHNWGAWPSAYGEKPGDTLRIMYDYPATSKSETYDVFGQPHHPGTGFLEKPVSTGCAVLHIDKSATDHSDWPAQPRMWAPVNCDEPPFLNVPSKMSEANWILAYEVMRDGFLNYLPYPMPEYPDQWEGMHKSVRLDETGLLDPEDHPTSWAALAYDWSAGPYTLGPGDSVRFVFALATGALSHEKAWEVGEAWEDSLAGDLWPESEWPGGDYGLPAQFDSDEILGTDHSDDANDLAKDAWVYTARDTLFRNASYAQWNLRNDFDAPIPPAAPSIEVSSGSDKITIEWGDESESYPGYEDFAGYRVYRATGNPDPRRQEEQLIGTWELIFECGAGTDNALTHSYADIYAVRGTAYYYYVAAFDDGSANGPDADSPLGGKPLESGKYLNRTTIPANLTRPPGKKLSDVRIIPNPYNFGSRSIQFPGEDDKIMFYDIPPYCTIKIFSESGDLVKTIKHDNGSGDQVWGIKEEEHSFSTTGTGQVIVSGIYIVYIVVDEDYRDPDTDELLYKKGDHTYAKFVVVR
jgi:hypothetical protein